MQCVSQSCSHPKAKLPVMPLHVKRKLEREWNVHLPTENSLCCHLCARSSGLSPWRGGTLGWGRLVRAGLGPGGWSRGAESSQVPASPHSPDPTVSSIPVPDSGKGFPHPSRKQSHSEVVGEEILVEREVISFKLQGSSSWGFQVASAQHFTVFLEKTLECLTTIYLSEAGNWEWKGRWFSFEQKGTAAVQAVALSVFTGSLQRLCLQDYHKLKLDKGGGQAEENKPLKFRSFKKLPLFLKNMQN